VSGVLLPVAIGRRPSREYLFNVYEWDELHRPDKWRS